MIDGIDFFDFSRINQQRQQEQHVQDTLGELVDKEWSEHGLPDTELPGHLPKLEQRYQQAYNQTTPLLKRTSSNRGKAQQERMARAELLRPTPKGKIFHDEIAQGFGPTSLLAAYLQLNEDQQHYFLEQRHKENEKNRAPLDGETWLARFKHNPRVQDLVRIAYTKAQVKHHITTKYRDITLDRKKFSTNADSALSDLGKYTQSLTRFKTLPNHYPDDLIHLIQQGDPEAIGNYVYEVNLDDAIQAYIEHSPKCRDGTVTPQEFILKYNLDTGKKNEKPLKGSKFSNDYEKTSLNEYIVWLKKQKENGKVLESTWSDFKQTQGYQEHTQTDEEHLQNTLKSFLRDYPSTKTLKKFFAEEGKKFYKRVKHQESVGIYTYLRRKRENGSIPAKSWNKLLQTKHHEGYNEHFYQLETHPAITPWPVTLDDTPKHDRITQILHKEQLQSLQDLLREETEPNRDLATKITYTNAASSQRKIQTQDGQKTKGIIFTEEVAPALGPTPLLQAYLELDAAQQTYLLQQKKTSNPFQGEPVHYKNYDESEAVWDLVKRIYRTKKLEEELEKKTPRERQKLNLRKRSDLNETQHDRIQTHYRSGTQNIEGFVKMVERRNPEAVTGYEYQPLLKKPETENPNFTELYNNVLSSDTEPALI